MPTPAKARIYRPAKNAMQSGVANTKHWMLAFVPTDRRQIDPLMGWTGSSDTRRQVRLWFDTEEAAVAYAERHGLLYEVEKPQAPKIKPKSYADNFRFDRPVPWSH